MPCLSASCVIFPNDHLDCWFGFLPYGLEFSNLSKFVENIIFVLLLLSLLLKEGSL